MKKDDCKPDILCLKREMFFKERRLLNKMALDRIRRGRPLNDEGILKQSRIVESVFKQIRQH